MITIAILVALIIVVQTVAHFKYVSRALTFWDIVLPFRILKEILLMAFITWAAEAVALAIMYDIYGNLDAAEIDHPDLSKKIVLLFVLLTWGGLSAYQYRGRIKIDYKMKDRGLNIGLAPLQSGLTKVVLSSIVTFISIVSAVLGIVGFYLDHLR